MIARRRPSTLIFASSSAVKSTIFPVSFFPSCSNVTTSFSLKSYPSSSGAWASLPLLALSALAASPAAEPSPLRISSGSNLSLSSTSTVARVFMLMYPSFSFTRTFAQTPSLISSSRIFSRSFSLSRLTSFRSIPSAASLRWSHTILSASKRPSHSVQIAPEFSSSETTAHLNMT